MYTVYIVDDENTIALGLEKVIDWQRLGCRTRTFTDSVKACGEAVRNRPDILITDIRMPFVDGLELIGKLHAKGIKPQSIILSGYSEFEYAKKGINLGVTAYILKPVEQKELESAVVQAITRIKEQNSIHHVLERMKTYRSWDITFQDIVTSNHYTGRDILDLTGGMDLNFTDACTVCVAVDFDMNPDRQRSAQTDALEGIIGQAIPPGVKYAGFYYTNHLYGIILNSDAHIGTGDCANLLMVLHEKWLDMCAIGSVIGIGSASSSISGVPQSFQQAIKALDYRIIRNNASVISYEDINAEAVSITIPPEIFVMLEDSIDRNDPAGAAQAIDAAFDVLLAGRNVKPLELQVQSLNILLASVKNLSYVQLQLNKALGEDILSLKDLSRFGSPEQLKRQVTDMVGIIIELKNRHGADTGGNGIIENIKKYIDEHYTENISLPEIAEHFYLNPFYLSQLFKKKAGVTYISYLTDKRMKKAKALLAKKDSRVYEVCHEVGYENTKHFSRTFEKIVGVKPSAYKDNTGQ